MPDFQAHIEKLEAALARGVLEVESDGERIKFQNQSELIQSINYFRQRAEELSPQHAAGPVREIATWYDPEW